MRRIRSHRVGLTGTFSRITGPTILPRIFFVLSVATLIFAYGVAVGKYKFFPHSLIAFAAQSVSAVFEDIGMSTGIKPTQHIKPEPPNLGKALPDGGQTDGYTLVSGFFDDGMEIRLLDGNGETAHRWPISYSEIWPDPQHVHPDSKRPQSDWNIYFNGILVQPDGSIVFPYHGLIKMDSCGDVDWKVPLMIHHSIEISPRGTFWAPGQHYGVNRRDHLPFKGDYFDQTVVEITADGEVLREFSIMDALKENGLLGLLSANNRPLALNREFDIIHLNDVEEIPAELVESFPMFSAGDILMSLREPNLLVVMDPETQKIKWYQVGPWNQQHDADWQPNGRITVYNNNVDGSTFGSILGGSSILSFNPNTGETTTLYGGTEEQHFYSSIQGDHQILENGNILITESTAGRVFEVTADGTLIWEFINRYAEGEVLLTSDAVRYPTNFLDISSWQCAPK